MEDRYSTDIATAATLAAGHELSAESDAPSRAEAEAAWVELQERYPLGRYRMIAGWQHWEDWT